MPKGHIAGSLTAGAGLMAFGLLFLSRLLFIPADVRFAVSLWPLTLTLLGLELVLACFFNLGVYMLGGSLLHMAERSVPKALCLFPGNAAWTAPQAVVGVLIMAFGAYLMLSKKRGDYAHA